MKATRNPPTADRDTRSTNGAGLETRETGGRSLVVHPTLKSERAELRTPEDRLDEAVGLARAIDLDVVHAEVVRVSAYRPATLLGQGAVDRLKALVEAERVEVAIVDGQLSPIQQRNLERAWKCKVIDRTGLILEIFGARARTAEGRLQVELASLTYQKSRLVRTWTHLERQRGGFGFLAGPGETQLESDRRIIGDRIAKLNRELDAVKRTRALHRKARARVPYPVVALVGYTNAGKSTLFNRLVSGRVLAADMLFATLDPTMRALQLPSGRKVILSDTVGFISDLPTDLVAAFRATLEEVRAADVIVHVRDIADPESQAQREDVHLVLAELGLAEQVEHGLVEVLNKIDLLSPEQQDVLRNQAVRNASTVPVSAITGEGIDALLRLLDQRIAAEKEVVDVTVPSSDGAAIAWLYRHGEVLERDDANGSTRLKVSLDPANRARFEHRQVGR
ncbi:MAG TPA: GTPase HflX [Alphaproteobacteria bacterium]|nr:GTPase HflX [Alphaproteobacteria bacterium]